MQRDHVHDLTRLQRHKQLGSAPFVTALGEEMVGFIQKTLKQRQTKLARIAESWSVLVPESLSDHCTLYALNRGTLTVLVDSAPHLYELKQLLLAGLHDQFMLACRSSGLRKIVLKPGRPENENSSSRARRCGGTESC